MDFALISSIAKIIGDGVAIAVIIYLYINLTQKREKEYDDNKKIYEDMIKKIITGVNSHYLTPKESQNIAQIERQINEIMQGILINTNASRVGLVKYHNGNKDMTGMSFLKMSMTNEVVNRGVAPAMCNFKDLFRSYLAYWCHEIDIKGICIFDNIEQLQNVDMTMYEYLKSRNVEAVYGRAIKDINNNIIGFLCVEYLDKKDFNVNIVNKEFENTDRKIEILLNSNRIEE